MRKPLEAIPTGVIISGLLLLLMESPILLTIARPFLQRYLPFGLTLVSLFLVLLLAASPFLIAMLVWRIKQRLQSRHSIDGIAAR